jgi:predicted ATP-grasp superfamily ATP-dependent carboligase
LLAYLLDMGRGAGRRSTIWPTRDDDVVFLDRYRRELAPYFIPMVPETSVVQACLDKWATYQWALRAGVPTPRTWFVENETDLGKAKVEVKYPCVLKPVAAHHWRQDRNWELVGQRKAIAVNSPEELVAEYGRVALADRRALVQEMIAGGDENLAIAACYLDRESNWVAGFNTQKVVQIPEGFGTGCIVQATDRPELFEPTLRLLQAMRFTGIAEVEYKWDAGRREYQLIEINPRPWDQHRLGKNCGTDLVFLAHSEYAGLSQPAIQKKRCADKWIAEDAFLFSALSLLSRRDRGVLSLFRLARGKRTYAIWSARDPVPLVAHMFLHVLPRVAIAAARQLCSRLETAWSGIHRPAPAAYKQPLK